MSGRTFTAIFDKLPTNDMLGPYACKLLHRSRESLVYGQIDVQSGQPVIRRVGDNWADIELLIQQYKGPRDKLAFPQTV